MNQKEAVFQVVKSLKPENVETDRAVMLSKQEKHFAAEKLFEGFKKGKVEYNQEMPSDDKLLMYVSGLVSNWLRKDKRLNGQTNYSPKRTIQRSAVDSEQLKAIRALTQSTSGSGNEEIQVFVIKRTPSPFESKPRTSEAQEKVTLPDEIKQLLGR